MKTFRKLSVLLIAASAAPHALAQEAKISLRLADSLPVGHVIHDIVTKPFIQAVAARTNGRVQIGHFPAEQLGKAKDLLMLTQSGVVDIGYVVPSYASDKMPLTAVAELPGSFRKSCDGTNTYFALTRDGKILSSDEFAPNHIRPLITFMLPHYQVVLSSGRKIESVKDLEGAKIRTAGGALDLTMRAINAVPVRMAPPEIYQSMSRGTLDGALLPYQSVTSYDLTGLLKSGTVDEPFGTVFITYSISEGKWAELPADVRQVLSEEGERITRESCKKFEQTEAASIEKVKAAGMRLVTFSPQDNAELDRTFEKVRQDWAAGLDSRGKPGTEVLRVWSDAVKAGE